MSPAARAAIVSAHMAAHKHAPRIANALRRAAHVEVSDLGRLEQLHEAKCAALEVMGRIQLAEKALLLMPDRDAGETRERSP